MRLKNHEIHARANGNLRVEFAQQNLTSYSGLELFIRYFRLIGLNFRIRRAFRDHRIRGDYAVVDMVLVFIALWLTGGRRLRHVAFIADDPLVRRLCGLASLPADRTISRWLSQFTNDSLQALAMLNSEIVAEKLRDLELSRITLDFDATARRNVAFRLGAAPARRATRLRGVVINTHSLAPSCRFPIAPALPRNPWPRTSS